MRIGALAKVAGCPTETIRYYEREGLLPKPSRSEGNYRLYGETHVQRLAFIRRCRSLDMALDEIRVLLRLRDAPKENCGEVNAVLDDHIGHVAARMADLRALKRQLETLRECCKHAQAARDCGILNALNAARTGLPAGPPARHHPAGSHARRLK